LLHVQNIEKYKCVPSMYITVLFQWEAKVERGQEEFDNISKMIKKEMERFEVNRVKDFKAIIIQYLENLMTHQQQVRNVYFYILWPL